MIEGMELRDWITISAVIMGPILAVQAQKVLESNRMKKQRRLDLFHTLMSTRAGRVSSAHVRALNMIDIEFYGRHLFGIKFQTSSEKLVTNSWKNYNDQLNTTYLPEQFPTWADRGNQLFTTLLYNMSSALGYNFDEVQLKRDCYSPIAHGNLEQDQYKLRKALLEVLEGTRALPFKQFEEPENKENETLPSNDS